MLIQSFVLMVQLYTTWHYFYTNGMHFLCSADGGVVRPKQPLLLMRVIFFKKNLNTRLSKDMILLGFLSSLMGAAHSVIRSGSAETN